LPAAAKDAAGAVAADAQKQAPETAASTSAAEPVKKVEGTVSKTVAEAQKVSEDINPANVQPDQAASAPAPANPQ